MASDTDGADIEVGAVPAQGVVEIRQSLQDRRETMMAVYYTPEQVKEHAERILSAVEALNTDSQ